MSETIEEAVLAKEENKYSPDKVNFRSFIELY